MPQRPTLDAKQFYQASAVLHVSDPKASAQHYVDRFGFTCDFVMPDNGYAVVWRENAALHFAKRDSQTQNAHLFLWVADADALYAEFKRRGAELGEEPKTQPYGIREFYARDGNGVLLVFGQDVE